MKRVYYTKAYTARRAVEEDNDDVVPLIEAEGGHLTSLYGEFYIAELLTRHPNSTRQLIVSEHEEKTVGLFCMNHTINYEVLQRNFELKPFRNLVQRDKSPSVSESQLDRDLYEQLEDSFM